MNLSIFDQAISFVRAGLSILPLHYPVELENGFICSCGNRDCRWPAKHPVSRLVPDGFKNASCEEDVVAGWFRCHKPCNIGIITGQKGNLVVLDVDPRHGGDRTLTAIEKKYGSIPSTCRFSIGAGGTHILFRHPGRHVPTGKLGPGVDVQGDGGYVVAPPSRHIDGASYSLSGSISKLAPLPEWIYTGSEPPSGQRVTYWRHFTGSKRKMERNDAVMGLSSLLLRHGVEMQLCLELLRAYNAVHCKPPLIPEQVATIVSNLARELAKRGIGVAAMMSDEAL